MTVRTHESLVPPPAPLHAVDIEAPEDVVHLPDRRARGVAFNGPLIIRAELNGLLKSVGKDIKLRQE